MKENEFTFHAADIPEALITLSKGKFFWRGQEVEDVHQIYERFHEWLLLAEGGLKNPLPNDAP